MPKNVYEIPPKKDMKVPGRIYASKKIFDKIKKDKTIEQIENVAKLDGIIGASFAMPDAHQGYGFCIGGVAAFDLEKGIVSPGGVGYDINCSVRLLKTNLTISDLEPLKEKIADALQKRIPSGVGRGSPFQLSRKKLDLILEKGAKYLVDEGYGTKEDYLNIEEEGQMKGANPSLVSERAKKRGIGQMGTLGAGNHFLDLLVVDEIFDEKVADKFGLEKNQIVILIHCGSRGLGHQIASDYIKKMEEEYGIKNLPDRELVNAPIKSKLGKEYLSAMACAANFAFANKQIITYWVRDELKKYFPDVKVDVVYEVCHNIAKIEEYKINGKKKKVCVHRKGATRSFGKGRKEIPKKYREVGQPVLIPGSMGTPSYVMVGTKKAEKISFGSSVHGAGREMSRSQSGKRSSKDVEKELKKKGITIRAGTKQSLSNENPQAYKDIEEVVDVVHDLGLSLKVAKLSPVIVIIG
ncbi:RNA-splicing ligase RtcB [Candidatus Pacearchaeota archaeon ex4484_71]|nr:MAG: RNA-splicing ligase RtcB [Candidatus Pacearchaeota archaeon ex4484_71]